MFWKQIAQLPHISCLKLCHGGRDESNKFLKGRRTMKKFSIRAISLILCMAIILGYALIPGTLSALIPAAKAATGSTGTVGANLIANGTFEPEYSNGKPVANTAEGWTNKATDTWSFIKDPDDSSNYVAYIVDDNVKTMGGHIYYVIDAPAAGTYCLSARYKTAGTTDRPSFYVRENSNSSTYTNSAGEKVNTPTQSTSIPATGGEWATFSFQVTVSDTAEKIYILINSANASITTAYFDDVSFRADTSVNKFNNLSFEETNSSGAVDSWQALNSGTFATNTTYVMAGSKSLKVTDNSSSKQQGVTTGYCNLYNYKIAGYATNDMYFTLTGRVKDTTSVKGQIALEFYDDELNKLSELTATSAKTGKWQYLSVEGKMPADTVYAKIALRVGDTASAKGTVYFDDLTVMPYYGQYMEEAYDWQLLDAEPGNRLYYTDAELAELKKVITSSTKNAFGVSGKQLYTNLIKNADIALKKESVDFTFTREDYGLSNITYTYDLTTMPDINSIEEFLQTGSQRRWPHLESIASTLKTYMQRLSLAYVLSGNEDYAEKAVDMALGICEWEYWIEEDYGWQTSVSPCLGIPGWLSPCPACTICAMTT